MNKKINFGIMCDSYELQQWQINCIEKILKLDNTNLKMIIINDNPVVPRKKTGLQLYRSQKNSWQNAFSNGIKCR